MASNGKAVAALVGGGGELDTTAGVVEVAGPSGEVAEGYLRIRPTHVALNPVDWKMPGAGILLNEEALPQTLGCDFAGTVEAVGPGVEGFAGGDVVYGYVPIDLGNGAFQDVFDTPAATTFALGSAGQSAAEAATLPVAIWTAVDAIFRQQAEAGAGHTLVPGAVTDATPFLVWGGSSAVGQAAIQLLSAVGFFVIATASPKHHERLQALGASVVVDYRAEDVGAQISAALSQGGKDLRFAFDTISIETSLACANLLTNPSEEAPGYVASVNPFGWEDAAVPPHVKISPVYIGVYGRDEASVAWTAQVKPAIEAFLPLQGNVVTQLGSTWADVARGLAVLQAGVSGTKLVAELAADPASR